VAAGKKAGGVVEHLVPGGADDEQGNAGRGVGDVLDKVEEDRLGPVNVVEDQDEGPAAGDRLNDGPHTPEQLVLAISTRAETHEGPNPQRGVLVAPAGERPQLGPCRLIRIIRENSCSLAEGFGDWPEGDAIPVGQASAPQHLSMPAHVADELLDQP